ncbi:mucoidy inhibitor MuiA family protein [Polaribacter sp. R2A056_3_33]|uniref:mucoidy inhibitor MuiA family protein n=1 Tax=Polaribacter sp. R2A056_3_33 TaxID=2745563 RepID=UPI001C4E87BA|nr:mucoidy inhibitor MuiA family protein [Polaribacter sp. R2A056_3_33]
MANIKFPLLITFCLFFCNTYSQEIIEKKIATNVNEVTVFLEGAQITRKKKVEVKQGKTILKFSNLSPFIDAKSIQVKAEGNITVLGVNHQQNFIEKLDKQKELVDLETKLKEVDDKIILERTYLQILKEELAFLKENRNIGGKNQEVSVTNLKNASIFFGTKLKELKIKEIERNNTLKNLSIESSDLTNQINTISGKKEFPNGEILVKIAAKNNVTANFELSYVVENAGWFPTYDIRAKNVNEPVELIYKASIKQDTKVSWDNVKLNLSSANPNVSGVAPELKTYFLNYNTRPPVYNRASNEVSGVVLDQDNNPLPGATVLIKGTTIGTSTDFDGKYSITIPNNESSLVFSYLGYISQTKPIQSEVLNIMLEEDSATLDEVVVIGYGTTRKRKSVTEALQGTVTGINIRGANSIPIPTVQTENQTTVDFEIKTPYTIKSDNKSYSVDIDTYNLPAFYQYYSVPKIDKNAFLIANISNWGQYNLLEGEANIFFEGTYIGKTLLDVRYATDTLQISLGRDKNVSVKRKKVNEFISKNFIGSKKEESRGWNIDVKNNKSQQISMVIYDQIPVSTNEDIKIEVSEISGAKRNNQSGEIKWEFTIATNESKNFILKYLVKYPKNKTIILE